MLAWRDGRKRRRSSGFSGTSLVCATDTAFYTAVSEAAIQCLFPNMLSEGLEKLLGVVRCWVEQHYEAALQQKHD